MDNNFSEIEQRVKRYWYTDGIGELISGVMLLLLGLYFSAQQYFGDRLLAGAILEASLVVILMAGMFVTRWAINALKTRVTYPRTGYVQYHTDGRGGGWRRVLTALLAMLVAALSLFITRHVDTLDAMVAMTGVLVAIILLIKQGWSSGMGRFYLLSAISLILGITLSISGLPRGYNLGLYYGLMAIAFALSGGLTLRHYLQTNPLPADAEREHE